MAKNPAMFASFCDGSKTNEGCCMIASAIGLKPDIRGMHGPTVGFEGFSHQVPRLLDLKKDWGILNGVCLPDPAVLGGDQMLH